MLPIKYILGTRGFFFFVQFCDMENLANVSKEISKITQIYSRKKILCFLVEKPTKVVENLNLQSMLQTFITCCDIGKLKEKKKKTNPYI